MPERRPRGAAWIKRRPNSAPRIVAYQYRDSPLMRLVCFWIGLLGSALLPAQDIDVAVLPGQSRALTILDEIRNGHERAAFLKLFKERQPPNRRRLAESFLDRWPNHGCWRRFTKLLRRLASIWETTKRRSGTD